MAVFDIGKGATFGGPDQLSYFDATKGLASLARQNSNALRNQRDALKYLEPVRDGLSGHEFLSSKNYSDYSKIMAEHGITPDALDDAMVGFMNSNGDPQYLTAVTTAFNKVRSDPRVRNIFKSEAVAKGKYDDYVKGEYNYVAPIFERALEDFDKTGDISGLSLNYPEIEMDAYVQDLKDKFTKKGKKPDVDLDNFRYSEYDIEVGDLEGMNNEIQSRLTNDYNFRAQMESKALNSGLNGNLTNPDGLPSEALREFTSGFFGNLAPNFGEEKIIKSYKSEDLSKEKIAALKREGKITEEQANDLTEGMDGQIDAILQEQGWENTAVNRSAARKILEDGVPAAVVTQLLKEEDEGKTPPKGRNPESAYDRQKDPDVWATWMKSQGYDIPKNDIGYYHDMWKNDYDQNTTEFLEENESVFAPKTTEEPIETTQETKAENTPKQKQIVQGTGIPLPEITEIEEATTWRTKDASVNLQKLSDKAKGVFNQLVELFPSAKSENIIVTDAYNEGRQSHAGGDSIDLRIRDNEGTIPEAADLSRWLLLTEEGQNFAEENELLIKLEYKTDKEKEQWKEFLNLTDDEYNKLVEDNIIFKSPKTTGPHIHINVGTPKIERGMRRVENEYDEIQQGKIREQETDWLKVVQDSAKSPTFNPNEQ